MIDISLKHVLPGGQREWLVAWAWFKRSCAPRDCHFQFTVISRSACLNQVRPRHALHVGLLASLFSIRPFLRHGDVVVKFNIFTSSILTFRENFLWLRNPVPVMPLVEVIRGLRTDDATLELTLQLCRAMKKDRREWLVLLGSLRSFLGGPQGNLCFHQGTVRPSLA